MTPSEKLIALAMLSLLVGAGLACVDLATARPRTWVAYLVVGFLFAAPVLMGVAVRLN